MTNEELTAFDIRAGAEKRNKNKNFIERSDKASYVLFWLNKKTNYLHYYIGLDYFADQFSGLHMSDKGNFVYCWKAYKKHFIDGSYYRKMLDEIIRHPDNFEYLLFFPVYSYSDIYTEIDNNFINYLVKYYNLEKYTLKQVFYTNAILFDMRNSEI